jgi:hypothetical protein
MKVRTLVLGAVAGAGAWMALAAPAAAYVSCNREGDCWHVDERYHQPRIRFDYHPDDWYFHRRWDHDDHMRWRDYHEGRGYWRGGVWVTF